MYKLPKGIQRISRLNKDGAAVVSFRVQMKRQTVKVDQLFDTLDEALLYLNKHRTQLGLKPRLLEVDHQQLRQSLETDFGKQILSELIANPDFSKYIKKYIETYIQPKYSSILEKPHNRLNAEDKKKLRNYKNTLSFYKTIVNTKVNKYKSNSTTIISKAFNPVNTNLGSLKINEITPNTINSYIKSRIEKGIKSQSIQREITQISNIFNKAKYLNEQLVDLSNPTRDYDRDLLKLAQQSTPKFFRFTEKRKAEFLNTIEKHKNPEFIYIVKIMLYTALRRSEAVLLKWSQIHENYIQLTDTKNNPRNVYLTKEAKNLIAKIPKKTKDNLFDYTVLGFDGSFKKFMNDNGFEEVKTHSLRKEAISKMIESVGAENSLLISELLGISNIRKLEETINNLPSPINNQSRALKSIGHASSTVTKKHYFSIKNSLK